MKAVLYAHDMEPITVVDLKPWAWDRLWGGEQISLAVMESPRWTVPSDPLSSATYKMRIVRISGEQLVRRGQKSLMLFTADEEHALALKAEFLPGQLGSVQSEKRASFREGFFDALSRMDGER